MLPFKPSIFLCMFIAVGALAQTISGSAAASRTVPDNAASVSEAAAVNPGIQQWKFAVVSIRKK